MSEIIKKQSYDIIDFPNPNDVETVKFCPNCSSDLNEWIFENDKAIKVPNKLQCHVCGEIVTIYHPSTLL